ncbi:hypothetical protein D9619_009533 [Psilocybe cf. subviscida]|uniref:Uncharacterized protein n=1 Tax=Psilocybe cf. subviscida TaxID=2480587 RepID=A0A8H5F6E9_9AGAR|nr:hypothetical protein D9619_009533 [Psilocybe cf. subviscida]
MPSVTSFDDPNPPFYPPPEWLSESPARPPPSHPGSTPKASPNHANQPRGPSRDDGWRQTPTGARRSSRSASAAGPSTPAATHNNYPKARLGLFDPTSASDSTRDQNSNRYSTRTRNTHYSTPSHNQNQNGHEASIDRNRLLSPVPPPPANLHSPQTVGAFNADPGVPFLATAGPTEDGSDDGQGDRGYDDADAYRSDVPASMRPGPGPRNLVGGLVSGIKNVVRKSTRRRREENTSGGMGEYDQYGNNRDYNPDYGYELPLDEPVLGAGTGMRDSGYAPSTPQYDDAPAPTPAQPTPASLYAKQIQEQERREQEEQRQLQDQRDRDRRRGPVSPIVRDFVLGAHPSPHRLNSQYRQSQSQGHTPAQAQYQGQPSATPRRRIIVDPGIDEYNDDPEAVSFTFTPPGVPPQRGYRLHDAPVLSPHSRSRLSRPPPLPFDVPDQSRPRPNLLSPPDGDTQTPPLPSPVSATPHYAPDYAQMNLPASALAAMGLRGDTSLRVYAKKVKRGWEAWRKLPWVVGLDDESDSDSGDEGRNKDDKKNKKQSDQEPEVNLEEEADWKQRVTWDYYPQRERRRIGRMGGRGGVWKDGKWRKGGSAADAEDDWDEDSEAAARRARVPAIVWRSPHYRVSLDEAAMPFVSGRPGGGEENFEDEEGPWVEDGWHEGAWDSDAHGHPDANSHYRGEGRGHESDPDGWMDIRPVNRNQPPPRWNVVITPQRRSYANMDLADEFDAVSVAPAMVNTPLPMNPPGGPGPLPMYPPGQTPAAPSGPMPYYPPVPPAAGGGGGPTQGAPGAVAPSRTRSVNGATPTSSHEPPPIEPIEDGSPVATLDRSRGFPPPLLPHPRPLAHQQDNTSAQSSAASTSPPVWSRPPPGQPLGTYAPMPPGFEDGAARRAGSRKSASGQYDPSHSPTHSHRSRAPSHRSGYSHISAASRPPPGQPPGTYVPFHEHGGNYPPPGAMQRQGSAGYAPSARSHASSQRFRPPPGQPPGTYPPFDNEHVGDQSHSHRREPAYGNGSVYAPSRASSNRSQLPPPPPPGQPPGTYPPQAHMAYTPSHASQRSHASRLSRTSHASSNPFRPPPGQPPGTYPPFRDEFTAHRGDHGGGGGEEEDEEGSYDNYTPTPVPRGTAGSTPSGGEQSSRSHISTRSHRLLQTPGPSSARSLAARQLAEASEEDDEDDGGYDHEEDYHGGGSGAREVYPQGYVPYDDHQNHHYQQEEEGADWHDPQGPGGPGYGEESHLTFRELLALRERRQQPPQ